MMKKHLVATNGGLKMTVDELITKLEKVRDKNKVVLFVDINGGWTNVKFVEPDDNQHCFAVFITPCENREK